MGGTMARRRQDEAKKKKKLLESRLVAAPKLEDKAIEAPVRKVAKQKKGA